MIGPGGKTIKAIIAATGASIDNKDDGTVLAWFYYCGKSDAAIKMIRAITDEVEVGRVYFGKVKRIMQFGAFVEILRAVKAWCMFPNYPKISLRKLMMWLKSVMNSKLRLSA